MALILSLWLTRGSALSQVAVILLWCAVEYIVGRMPVAYFIAAALAAVPVFLYNGKLGRPLKTAFYFFYPVHLAVLGILTVRLTLV